VTRVPVACRTVEDGRRVGLIPGGVDGSRTHRAADEERSLQPGSVAFLTTPVTGTGMEGDQSVVYLDETADAALWKYLNDDSLAQHVAQFKQLPPTPN